MQLPPFIARFRFARFCLVLLAAAFLSSCKEETPEAPLLTITAISPDTGPKNGFVTLTGTGFGTDPAANVVTLNDKPCVVTAASANYLTFTIPAKAGSGPIMVKANGQTAQSQPFTYIFQAMVTTLAGSTQGFADGTGASAQFDRPVGVAVGPDGNVYVADAYNHRIRKINPAGVVTTLAGSTQGFADGTGASAQFDIPFGVAVGADGSLYVADSNNDRIRKITPAGVVSTVIGSTEGFADGTGTDAQFNYPTAMSVGMDGTLYVADYSNNRIRKVTPAGVVTTVAGGERGFADGTGTAAQFSRPSGLAMGADGSLFVADYFSSLIRKITPAGVVSTFAGSARGFADGTGASAQFDIPYGIAIGTDGTLYVADEGNNRIRKITPAGVVSTVAGGAKGFADGTAARFNEPACIAVGADGSLYVTDYNNHRIRKIVLE